MLIERAKDRDCVLWGEIETHLLDKRNLDLWNYLIDRYDVAVLDGFSIYKLDYISDSEPVAITVKRPLEKGLFTHELLHLELRAQGLESFSYFEKVGIKQEHDFIQNAGYTLCNTIEHIFFFDDFIEMGFDPEEFVADYRTSRHSKGEFEVYHKIEDVIGNRLGPKIYYYALLFTLLSERYMGLQRNKELERVAKLSKPMYNKGMGLYDAIIDFDFEPKESVQERLDALMDKYIA